MGGADEEVGRGSLPELARLFTRLGFTAFGGPAAHIAMMHDEVVTRRGWLDEQRFLDLMGVTNLIPGPNSTEMTMHIGHQRAGWRGLITAGSCFILPAALIVLGFAWFYVQFGETPSGQGILYGVKPVVVVIVAQALLKLGRTVSEQWLGIAVAVGAAAAYLLGVNELLVLAFGGVLVLALRTSGLMSISLVAFGGALMAQAETADITLGRLFLVFLRVGTFLYGSGYVLLAFLHGDLVDGLAVLSNQELLDAIAIGQFTPGPVFTTATFVGYYLGGFPGAVVATVGIFLPGFLFVGAVTPLVRRIRDRVWTAALLDGVNAAALGLMGGVLLQLGRDALTDPLTIALAVVAALLLWRTKLNSAWLIVGAGLIGLATNMM